jgi:hypothetical protein
MKMEFHYDLREKIQNHATVATGEIRLGDSSKIILHLPAMPLAHG